VVAAGPWVTRLLHERGTKLPLLVGWRATVALACSHPQQARNSGLWRGQGNVPTKVLGQTQGASLGEGCKQCYQSLFKRAGNAPKPFGPGQSAWGAIGMAVVHVRGRGAQCDSSKATVGLRVGSCQGPKGC
jgi:hypothetical protein